ncbi:thioesterase II family protein [Dyella flagellata]|uniref:Thioesterase n=1 Tax=Dyella flagellata TaxID=1867833 RepID=A0ABQ5X8Y5_9GAMM|nr:thioesterase domain-containing protein [Dyella flagellata]GLQ87377.1 thioesterase [Dyella flagellata]
MAVSMRASAVDPGRWFRRFGAHTGTRRRLICFHHAGGGPSSFREWQRYVAPHTEVWAAAIPGRETRFAERPLYRLDTLAMLLADVMPLDLPFAFFGHSVGGVVAFEVARQLHERRLPLPQRLFVSACCAPQLCRREKSRASLSDAELLHTLQSYAATSKEVLGHPEYLQMVLSVLRADFNLVDSYAVPEGCTLRLPITAYAGTADKHITPTRILAWERWALPGFACRSFDGDHFYLNHQRVALIDDLLARWSHHAAMRFAGANT